jgi:hypothetical protein
MNCNYSSYSLEGVILDCFKEGAVTIIPEKIRLVGFVSEAQLRMNAIMNNFKKNSLKKPDMFCIKFDCCHLNQA